MLRVLGHFETGGGDATGVHGLARSEEDPVMLEIVDGARLAAHVGDFAAAPAAVRSQFLRIVLGEFVLESAREGNVHRDGPRLLARGEERLVRELGSHILHHVAVGGAHDEHVVDHLLGDTVRDVADTVRAGDRDDLGAELGSLGGGAPGDVAEAGEGDLLALDVLARLLEKVLGEIQGAEARGFRTEDGTAPGAALAGQDAGVVLAGQLLVHAIEVTDLTAAHAHVTGRDILVRADAVPELQHESLAETHDLVVGLAHGVEVGAALGAAHRKGGEGVLERLLEAEELEHGRGHGLVETETALIGTDGAVELDAVAEVRLDLALVVHPGHTEGEDAVGFDHPLHDLCLLELRMLVIDLFDGFEDFLHGLKVLLLERVLGLELCHDVLCLHDEMLCLVF